MGPFGKLVVAGVATFAGLQAIRPGIPAKPPTAEVQAPAEVKRVLEKDCYSCHSDQRRLLWFDEIVPGYWLVRHDVLTAREHLNFSTLGSKPAAAQRAALYEAVNMIQLGAMPLPAFLRLHPDARVTPEELQSMKDALAPWTAQLSPVPAPPPTGAAVARVNLATVPPELNGFAFAPDFENWKLLSTTDRGDNDTFRFILGNDIAIKAAQSGNISPWPDGARFAKVTWQKVLGPDGPVQTGKFIQVELMLKDAKLYKDTEGWGWGRWRGLDLKPYGTSAAFVGECTGCHQPMHGNDYVYTLPISAAKPPRTDLVNDQAAALPATLPFQPLSWGVITMSVDPRAHTVSTLFGNDVAMQAVQASKSAAAPTPVYPAGSILALVTWSQREDPHWFGARIPNAVQSVEFVQVAPGGHANEYQIFSGTGSKAAYTPSDMAAIREAYLLRIAPAQLP